ncbi:malonyl-CoA-acyl carrier protein transacylase, mitochondrial-like protein [Sarcoptes scabiei]|uniref:[acyl-carrier-protein] S-malonyltransferase n=1 Tax=Sarcoptes scabiei TaxID=52283 RepID=A0A131ZWB4_SARSC|nr:malonyl-CoA-acyl carrier protein transacylase, mitochondrial-like protein [Sarcoptes scabiei]
MIVRNVNSLLFINRLNVGKKNIATGTFRLEKSIKNNGQNYLDVQKNQSEIQEAENESDYKLQIVKSKLKTDPSDTTVILFPGQGSQFVGMGSAIFQTPNVEKLFTLAKSILGYDILRLCIDGPIETLSKTEFCQPAIFVTSLGAVEYLRYTNNIDVESCVSTAGFSIGEITSLVFANAMSFEDGLRLVKLRAEAMQYSSDLVPSAMCTVFLFADAQVKMACQAAREWCKRLKIPDDQAVCSIANHLFPHCKVIAGHVEAIKFLELNTKDFGFKRMKRIPVSGAFHTPLMKPAESVMAKIMEKINLNVPLIPVYSNYDAKIYKTVDEIREKLTLQVCSPVKWEQILHRIYDRPEDVPFPKTYECGPGNGLLSTIAMVNRLARKSSQNVNV